MKSIVITCSNCKNQYEFSGSLRRISAKKCKINYNKRNNIPILCNECVKNLRIKNISSQDNLIRKMGGEKSSIKRKNKSLIRQRSILLRSICEFCKLNSLGVTKIKFNEFAKRLQISMRGNVFDKLNISVKNIIKACALSLGWIYKPDINFPFHIYLHKDQKFHIKNCYLKSLNIVDMDLICPHKKQVEVIDEDYEQEIEYEDFKTVSSFSIWQDYSESQSYEEDY